MQSIGGVRMDRFRISVARMMLAVFLIAVIIGPFMRPTRLNAASIYSATCLLLVAGTIRSIAPSAVGFSFWRGFAIAGWLGFVLHFGIGQRFSGHHVYSFYSDHAVDSPSLFVIDSAHYIGRRLGLISAPVVSLSPTPAMRQFLNDGHILGYSPATKFAPQPPSTVPVAIADPVSPYTLGGGLPPDPVGWSGEAIKAYWAGTPASGPLIETESNPEFIQIGYCIICLVLATIGGVYGGRLERTITRRNSISRSVKP